MAKLVWDKDGERSYELGVTKCVLYPRSDDGKSYMAGIAWNGITSIQESPDGAEPNDLYADDMKYGSLRSTETYGGTIEAYTYPDEFMECDGTAGITGLKMLHIGQQRRKGFGLCYRTTEGDDLGNENYKIHIVYNCTASPSDRQYETINDSPDAITFSWEFDTTSVGVNASKIGNKDIDPVSTVVIDSSRVPEGVLELIEDALYGTKDDDPWLPTVEQLYELVAASYPDTTNELDEEVEGGN